MSKKIAVIVEGNSRERKYWRNIQRIFFNDTDIEVFTLSAGINIYSLWKQIKLDENETDIIEVLKEFYKYTSCKISTFSQVDFEEIFLFFDYDPQQNNLKYESENPSLVISEMFNIFDNETENGKLYMSYPMCEALRDVREKSCLPVSKCKLPLPEIKEYKKITSTSNKFLSVSNYSLENWLMILAVFLYRIRCLYKINLPQKDLFTWYKENLSTGIISPSAIYEKEHGFEINSGNIFVLSAFPEFLLDYFKPEKFISLNSYLQEYHIEECKHLFL